MKLFNKILIASFGLLLASSVTSCEKENKYVRVAVPETVDGTSLYLTGKATGKQGVANYVLFDQNYDEHGYIDEIFAKLEKSYAGVDVAYVEVEELDYLFSKDKASDKVDLKIIYIDSYKEDGTINAVWVARNSWIKKSPTFFPKFVKGLVDSANYRATNSSLTINYDGQEVTGYTNIKNYLETNNKNEGSWIYNLVDFTDYNFNDYTNVYEYCAIYNIQNSTKVNKSNGVDDAKYASSIEAKFIDINEAYNRYYTPNVDGSGNINVVQSEELDGLLALCGSDRTYENTYSLNAMVKAINDVYTAKPKENKPDIVKGVIMGGALLVVCGFAAFMLIRRRIKTGKRIFNIKEALDADIESE